MSSFSSLLATLLLIPFVSAACPQIHIFGARETTVSAGYGSSGTVVNSIISAFPGATSEAINYPACGGQSSCGGVSYAQSVIDGVNAVASQVNSFNTQCPSALLVLVGYSQGGQIFDDAYCGGGDSNEGLSSTASPLSAAAQKQIKAAIFMGDPRFVAGASYEVGTCKAQGFAPRPAGFQCPYASNIQSYCDAADPYCCNGNDANTHQGYGTEYGAVALTFVKNKLNVALGSGGSTGGGGGGGGSSGGGGGGSGSGTCSALYGQCGGIGFTGPTCCSSGTCKVSNSYYSQCLN